MQYLCKNCNTSFESNDISPFCPHCGSSVGEQNIITNTPPSATNSSIPNVQNPATTSPSAPYLAANTQETPQHSPNQIQPNTTGTPTSYPQGTNPVVPPSAATGEQTPPQNNPYVPPSNPYTPPGSPYQPGSPYAPPGSPYQTGNPYQNQPSTPGGYGPPQQPYSPPAPYGAPYQPQKKKNTGVIIAIILFVILGVVGFFILYTQEDATITSLDGTRFSSSQNLSTPPEYSGTLAGLSPTQETKLKQYGKISGQEATALVRSWLYAQEDDANFYRHVALSAADQEQYIAAVELMLTAYNIDPATEDLAYVESILSPKDAYADDDTLTQLLEALFEKPLADITWRDIGKITVYSEIIFDDTRSLLIGTNKENTKSMVSSRAGAPTFLYGLTFLEIEGDFDFDTTPLLYLQQVDTVYITQNALFTSFAPLTTYPKLNDLYISKCPNLTSSSELEQLIQLKGLFLNENGLSDLQLSELNRLKTLSVLEHKRISNLDFLEKTPQLLEFAYSGEQVTDFSPLQKLPKLIYISLNNTTVEDFSFVKAMPDLEAVYLLDNKNISSVAPLANKTTITTLSLSGDNITDIETLASLTGLESLYLENPADIGFVSNFSQLELLSIEDLGRIPSFDPLDGLTNLKYLYFNYNDDPSLISPAKSQVMPSLSALSSLTSLEQLYIGSGSYWGDTSAIFQLPNLQQLRILNAQINAGDTLLFESLPRLSRLELDNVEFITNIEVSGDSFVTYTNYDTLKEQDLTASLAGCTKLTRAWLHNLKLTNVLFMKEMKQLEDTVLTGNDISDISTLANLPKLSYVELSNANATGIETLRKNGITVEIYD